MNQELLHKYFKGDTSIEEEKQILDWVDESGENRKALQKERMLRWSARIAAMIIIAVSFGYLWKDYQYNKIAQVQKVSVPAGQRAQIILADGTKIWLNAQSTLCYGSNFGRTERNVELDGEAYFEVTKNEAIPISMYVHIREAMSLKPLWWKESLIFM